MILISQSVQGKSLSLICAALTWLRRHRANVFESTLEVDASTAASEPAWVVEQLRASKRDDFLREWQEREERLQRARLIEKQEEERAAALAANTGRESKRRRRNDPEDDNDSEDEWFLEEPGVSATPVLVGVATNDDQEEMATDDMKSPVKVHTLLFKLRLQTAAHY